MPFYDDIPNVADCSDVAQLYECALLTINNSKLLRDWVNGSVTTDVVLGGQAQPSLRKLIQNINRVAGIATSISPGAVRPDNVTTQVDALGVLSVIAAGIIKNGGGLVAGTDGKLLVDFSTMPASQLSAMLSSLIQTGGGLSVNSEGKFYFDAQSMDTEVFENMLKKLRLPKWLTGNKEFYVNQSHANASDTLDEGRGESPNKPFKTIQACINYVTNNYNLGPYILTITVYSGTYKENLTLGAFTSTTGYIHLHKEPMATRASTIIENASGGSLISVEGGIWRVENFTLKYTQDMSLVTSKWYRYPIRATDGVLQYIGNTLTLTLSGAVPSSGQYLVDMLTGSGSGQISIIPGSNNVEITLPSAVPARTRIRVLTAQSGSLTMSSGNTGTNGDISVSGSFNTFALAVGGPINVNVSNSVVFTFTSGSPAPTGKRYEAASGGTINTNGSGPDYFPGTIAGTAESATYSWYK